MNETPDVQLAALSSIAWKLPEQDRHEIQSMDRTRLQTGHLRWLSPVQQGRLTDLYRKHVLGYSA